MPQISELIYRYPQLTLGIKEGNSQAEEYLAIVKKGKLPLELKLPIELSGMEVWEQVRIPDGIADIIYLPDREVFEYFVGVLAYRCEPKVIPPSMGAVCIRGLNNWRKIETHKKEYLAAGGMNWKEEFKKFTSIKENYQDVLILISRGGYSGLPSWKENVTEDEWLELSKIIRTYHELAHVVSGKLFPDNKNAVRDEVIADAIGIRKALGYYDEMLAAKVLGIVDDCYCDGGRLENYVDEEKLKEAVSYCKVLIKMLGDYFADKEGMEIMSLLIDLEQQAIGLEHEKCYRCFMDRKRGFMIPAYCMEEHHEAFYYWHLAIAEGYLKEKDNTLLHIDHHDDFEGGGYYWDFTQKLEDLEERRKFTYEKLGIADFIVPAIYEGVFSYMLNMKKVLPRAGLEEEKFVERIGNNTLSVKDYKPFLHSKYKTDADSKYRFFTYREASLVSVGNLKDVVMDIDLDYFCWDDSLSTVEPKRMEITKAAYEEYKNDIYHPFRILPKIMVYAEEFEGKYYMRYQEPYTQEKIADEERIEKRVQRFFYWLKEQAFTPSLITICRSAHSGYLPAHRAEFVEQKVKAVLNELYEINWLNN